ncbi:MAG: hypothetical protein Fur006_05280 [Coleofasciculaceae cyanobacterium]
MLPKPSPALSLFAIACFTMFTIGAATFIPQAGLPGVGITLFGVFGTLYYIYTLISGSW